MSISRRIHASLRVASIHLVISLIVGAGVAAIMFGVWYPYPYNELTKAPQLFGLLMMVDIVCGPLLTGILYRPQKPKYQWRLDLALIAFIQLAAMVYGLNQVTASRPVWLAFEIDRFRIVQWDEIQPPYDKRPSQFQVSTPQLIGVSRLSNDDPSFPASIQLSLNGIHPSFRPDRWVSYESQKKEVIDALFSLDNLKNASSSTKNDIRSSIVEARLQENDVGYLPLVLDIHTDWIFLINKKTGNPIKAIHTDGW